MKYSNCLTCKETFKYENKGKIRKFCSPKCYALSMIGYTPKSPPPHNTATIIECRNCNKKIKRLKKNHIFCSLGCVSKYKSKISKRLYTCKMCNSEFHNIPSYGKNIFCSKACFGKYNSGKRSASWKGGIKKEKDRRKSYECVQWKKDVLIRDNFTCRLCKLRGGSLVPHHILFYSDFVEYRSNIMNGITLCKDCHKRAHTIFNRKYFKENPVPIVDTGLVKFFIDAMEI